ncbi:hypothetical protein BOH72_23395 [Mycobacterium sp. WY10]|nr:hypothetical protein BOH72_23395 [Mycobacterium sp. WY10]
MPEDEGEPPTAQWILDLGITDRASGIEKARASRGHIERAVTDALKRCETPTFAHHLMMGLATRGLGLHSATVQALEQDNPYAAFTLIRSLAENAAAALYGLENPAKIEKLLGLDGKSVSIGQITSHVNQRSKRFGEFRGIYSELSQYAHPMSKSLFASSRIADGNENQFNWSTQPRFKFDGDFLTACGWVVELSTANAHLLFELGDIFGPE